MDLAPEPLPSILPSGWTEPVLVCSPNGQETVAGIICPQDGVHLSRGVWFQLEGDPVQVWPALKDEAALIFSRHSAVFIAAQVNEIKLHDHPWNFGLSILGQIPA